MLEQKDYTEFLWNLSKADLLAEQDHEMIAEISYLKVQGFFMFNQYKKGVEFVEDALKYNKSEKALRLKNCKGIMLGYLGELSAARQVFLDFINDVKEVGLLVEVYLNLSWVVGTQYKLEKETKYLEELKQYLDLAHAHFNDVSNLMKGRILDNTSFYYYSIGNLEEAISIGERAVNYFEEKDLPAIYNNLAAMYLELDRKDGGCSVKTSEYMDKAEVLGEKYENNIEIGMSQYNQALARLQEGETISAIDMLSSACEYFKKAQALTQLCDCQIKINELLSQYKEEQLKALRDTVKRDLEGTSLFKKM